jgi:hypothetical protein
MLDIEHICWADYLAESMSKSMPLLENFMHVFAMSGGTAAGPHFCLTTSTDFSSACEHSCNALSSCCSRCWWEKSCSWCLTLMRTRRCLSWSLCVYIYVCETETDRVSAHTQLSNNRQVRRLTLRHWQHRQHPGRRCPHFQRVVVRLLP